ncbi:MAG TPA: hypothetical protein PK843_06225 [bacterium]|nr:hypothetical protein [bacterium]
MKRAGWLLLTAIILCSQSVTAKNMSLARVYAKVWLEGPYDASTGMMRRTPAYKAILDTLKRDWDTHFLQTDLKQPITALVPQALDFILVYLRRSESGEAVLAANIGILGADGFLYDLYGNPGITLNVRQGVYFIILVHRNHLPVQSSRAVDIAQLSGNMAGRYYDFTVAANCYSAAEGKYNEPVKSLSANVYGLFAGNASQQIGMETTGGGLAAWPKIIASLDMTPVQQQSGDDPRYTRADTDLSGVVIYALDAAFITLNSGVATEAPMPLYP